VQKNIVETRPVVDNKFTPKVAFGLESMLTSIYASWLLLKLQLCLL